MFPLEGEDGLDRVRLYADLATGEAALLASPARPIVLVSKNGNMLLNVGQREDGSIPQTLPVMRVVDPFLASDMAEYVLAQVMASLKDLHRYKRDQVSTDWHPRPYRRIEEVTVGIMGLGTLGRAVAELLGTAGFSLVGWTRASQPEVDFPTFSGLDQKKPFLEKMWRKLTWMKIPFY